MKYHAFLNSILVICIGTAIAWLTAAYLYASFKLQLPILPCSILFLIVHQGFRNRPQIRTHCGWTILLGCLVGSGLAPATQAIGRLSIEDELFGFFNPFGSTNAALIGAATILTIFAVWECVSSDTECQVSDPNTKP